MFVCSCAYPVASVSGRMLTQQTCLETERWHDNDFFAHMHIKWANNAIHSRCPGRWCGYF
jgi:hypothetical protein